MNKSEFIEALSARLGDRKTASAALDAILGEIQKAVTKGDKVTITGFGVFEKRVRAPRTARNPRTGETVKVKKTSVPAFRPGSSFKEMVAAGKVPKTAPATKKSTPAPANRRPATPVKKAAKATAAKKVAPAAKAAAATNASAATKAATSTKKALAKSKAGRAK